MENHFVHIGDRCQTQISIFLLCLFSEKGGRSCIFANLVGLASTKKLELFISLRTQRKIKKVQFHQFSFPKFFLPLFFELLSFCKVEKWWRGVTALCNYFKTWKSCAHFSLLKWWITTTSIHHMLYSEKWMLIAFSKSNEMFFCSHFVSHLFSSFCLDWRKKVLTKRKWLLFFSQLRSKLVSLFDVKERLAL